MIESTNSASSLDNLLQTMDIDNWYLDLLGQPATHSTFDLHVAMARIPRTEISASEEIKRKFGSTVSYSAATDTWFIWDGRVHAPCDGTTEILKITKLFFLALNNALQFVKDVIDTQAQVMKASNVEKADEKAALIRKEYDGEWKKFRVYRDYITKIAGRKSLMDALKTELDIPADHFDGDRKFLVVRNGVIDLAQYRMNKRVTLLPHSADRAVYRYFDADFDVNVSEEDYPQFRRFLSSSICDWDTAVLLQKFTGAAFSAPAKPRAMVNLLGAPASGKSMFLNIFNVLGQDYSVMPNNQAIQANTGDTNFYQDALRGARFIGFSEVQGAKDIDDGFVKGIMGGDEQNTRLLRQQESPWMPQGVMFVASNLALKINFRDKATTNKIFPITFPHSFTREDPEHQIDELLEAKILGEVDGSGNTVFEGERPGILHWVLKGMMMYWEEGLAETASVLTARASLKTNASHSIRFMTELLETGLLFEDLAQSNSSYVLRGDVYRAFEHWCAGQNVRNVPGKQTFNSDVEEFYHGDVNSGGRRFKGLVPSPEWLTSVSNITYFTHMMENLDERMKVSEM